MASGNLIPAFRRIARQRRRLWRRWLWAVAIYGGAVGLCLPLPQFASAGDEHLADQVAASQQEAAQREAALRTLRTSTDEARATLNATLMVENQSNWSYLLGVIVAEMGDEVVLRDCTLKPDDAATAGSPAAPRTPEAGARSVAPQRYRIELAGYGRTQMAVSQFVLRLERTSLFARVTLEESRREGFLKGDAIAFRLRCTLAAKEATAP